MAVQRNRQDFFADLSIQKCCDESQKTFFLGTRFNTRASHRNKKKSVSCNIDKGKSKKASASCKHSNLRFTFAERTEPFFSPVTMTKAFKSANIHGSDFCYRNSFFFFYIFPGIVNFLRSGQRFFFSTGNVSIVLWGA